MISFDYLRSARPEWLQRLLEIRIPERLQGALLGVAAAAAFIVGACSIEYHRLSDAQHIEAAYRQRFEMSEHALQKTRIYYDRVKTLVNLDRRVRAIVVSGDVDALRLAEIANNLPPHTWLTQITRDDAGMALEGRADNLSLVSGVLRGLIRARHLRNAMLSSAQTLPEHEHRTLVKYVMHVEGTGS